MIQFFAGDERFPWSSLCKRIVYSKIESRF